MSRLRRALVGPFGLQAKWRALLFVVGMVLLLPFTLEPVNWLSSRGLLGGRSEWEAGVHWAAFVAALLPTFAASRMERRPLGAYGLPLRSAFGARFWEAAAWGLGAVTLLIVLLLAGRGVSFTSVPVGPETLRFGAIWAVTMLGVALFEQYSTRGYLQVTVARRIGFWKAALLLSCLFALEDLLSPSRRSVLRFTASVAYGLLFCLILRRTGSLWFAVGLHFALGWGMVFLYGMPTPLSSPAPPGAILHPMVQGPDWLTGGKYGLDGSILTLLLIGLLWAAVTARFPEMPETAGGVD